MCPTDIEISNLNFPNVSYLRPHTDQNKQIQKTEAHRMCVGERRRDQFVKNLFFGFQGPPNRYF